MKREELLQKATEITKGAREQHYGKPENNFNNIARLWKAYFENIGYDIDVTPSDVAILMILMKTARLCSDSHHDDSWLDIAGYASCGSEINNG